LWPKIRASVCSSPTEHELHVIPTSEHAPQAVCVGPAEGPRQKDPEALWYLGRESERGGVTVAVDVCRVKHHG
jgi:hypothetical protein